MFAYMSRLALAAFAVVATACARPQEPAAAAAADAGVETESAIIIVEPFGPPAPPRPTEPLRVIVAGDLIPHRPSLVAPGALVNALQPLAALFGEADSVVAN